MQSLTAQPRELLSPEQVTQILKTPALQVSGGCELLRPDLTLVRDISDSLVDGSVGRVMNADIHGTCGLTLTEDFNWGVDLFRPYMYTTDANYPWLSARWYLGVYSMTTPKLDAHSEDRVVNGYDRNYLLDRPVGDTYEVAAGTGYITAMRKVITDAGLTGVLIDNAAEAKTLPKAMVWPLIKPQGADDNGPDFATFRSIFNDLAKAIGYNEVWTDFMGRFRSEPYVDPKIRPIEFTFDSEEQYTILGMKRTQTYDLWKTPTRFIFIQQNRPDGAAAPTEGDGIYTYNLPDAHPASAANRGMVWAKPIMLDAADQASLVTRGNRIVTSATSVVRSFRVETGPFPAAGHFDVFSYYDSAFGGKRRVQATRWEQNVMGGNTVWTWEEVA